jgi:hypothetical protein
MCLGLYIDEFNPFRSFVALYSYWQVILTIYILRPGMFIRQEFMFLSMVIPNLNSPGWNIDIYLQPLINELMYLWSSRALTYDVSRKYNFNIKAALM